MILTPFAAAVFLLASLPAGAQETPPPSGVDFELDAAAVARICAEAVERAGSRLDAMEKIPENRQGFTNLVADLDSVVSGLKADTAAAAFLKYVSTDKQIRDASHACETTIEKFLVDVYSRNKLYSAVKNYSARPTGLDPADRRLLVKTLEDFRKQGQDLSYLERTRFNLLRKFLIDLKAQFGRNLSKGDHAIFVTAKELTGLPADYVASLEKGLFGVHKISLDYPDYITFMQNASDEDARRRLDSAIKNQAAPENVILLEEILNLRRRLARTLGYRSYAEFALKHRMAGEPKAVTSLLKDVERAASKTAKKELDELLGLKKQEVPGAREFYSWDYFYYHNKRRDRILGLQDEQLRDYFPMGKVLAGMLETAEKLFAVKFVEASAAQAWHPDVKRYEMRDPSDDSLLGHVFFDMHPRDGKYKHAASFNILEGKREASGGYRTPVSALVANFAKPKESEDAYLKHGDVVTLFHEFGHLLHQTLSRGRYARFAAARVERDFVEVPAQLMENWAWDKETLKTLTRHRKTGEALPEDLSNRLAETRNLHLGLRTLRQVFYAGIDQTYHGDDPVDTTEAYRKDYERIALIKLAPDTHPHASFGYLMTYAASYYGYLWSELYAWDLFSIFREKGIFDRELGEKYRKTVLEPGAGEDPAKQLSDFLGRQPKDDAYYRFLSGSR